MVVWFTGLPGAGKTTLATRVSEEFRRRSLPVEVLDSEALRRELSAGLGFTQRDREIHIRRLAFVTGLLARHGVNVMVAAITPYQSLRDEVRATLEAAPFVEVFVDCPLEVLLKRDPKGLYRMATAGQIENFSGISDSYERPLKPEVIVRTDTEGPEESTSRIIGWLEGNSYLRAPV